MAAPTLVNSHAATVGGSPRTNTFGFTVTAGDLIVLWVGTTTDNGSTPTCPGYTLGNDGTNDATVLAGTTRRTTMLWKVAAGGETSAQVTQTGVTSLSVHVEVYNHADGWPANPVDAIASATGGGTSVNRLPTSGTISVANSVANAVVGAAVACATHTNSAINGLTIRLDDSSGNFMFSGDTLLSATTTTSTFASWTTNRVGCMLLVAFKTNAATAVTGTAAVTLDNVTSSVTATETITGTAAVTLDPNVPSASATETISGTSTQTLADFTSAAQGYQIRGTVAATLDDLTSSASGTETITGTSANTLDDATSDASVTETMSGTSAQTLDDLTSAADGTVANPVTGTVDVALDDFTSTATGTSAAIVATTVEQHGGTYWPQPAYLRDLSAQDDQDLEDLLVLI